MAIRLILFILAAIYLGTFSERLAAAGPPNFVFLLADDMRYDAIGAHGNPIVQTPNLDQLATKGVSFNRAFVTTSICMISRASIMTGQYAKRHEILTFTADLTVDQLRETYFAQLKQAGYSIGFVGKWGVGTPPKNIFDNDAAYAGQGKYYGPPTDSHTHLTSYLGRQASEYLAEQKADRPFCLSVSFKAPHVEDGNTDRPFNYDRRLADLYAETQIPEMPLSGPSFFAALPKFLQESENRLRWEQRFATNAQYQKSVRGYYRLVTGMDRVIGDLLDQLEAQGLAENTVIVFASDHGFYLGERGFAGKWYPHDISIRIPLIVHDPRQKTAASDRRTDAIALNIDIAPTLLDYAGLTPSRVMQGHSLKPIVEGHTPQNWRTEFYYEHEFVHPTIPESEAVRTETTKYIVYPKVAPIFEELYDLTTDPDEANNLATNPDHNQSLEHMRHRLEEWREQVR